MTKENTRNLLYKNPSHVARMFFLDLTYRLPVPVCNLLFNEFPAHIPTPVSGVASRAAPLNFACLSLVANPTEYLPPICCFKIALTPIAMW